MQSKSDQINSIYKSEKAIFEVFDITGEILNKKKVIRICEKKY